MTDNKRPWYIVLALGTISVWGVTFVSTKVLLTVLSPIEIMFLRCVIAYVVLLLIYPKFHKSEGAKQELHCLGAALTGITLYFLAENYALTFTQAANVSLLVSAAPILTALVAHLFTADEKFTTHTLYGFLVAIAGVALVVFNGQFVLRLSPVGDFLALGAALIWAFYTILMRKLRTSYPPVYITRRIFFYAIVTILPFILGFNHGFPDLQKLVPVKIWGNLLFLGVIASAVCYVTWAVVIRHLGAVRANNYVYLNPLVTMLASAVVLRERITPLMLAGAGLTLLGVMLAEGILPQKRQGERLTNE